MINGNPSNGVHTTDNRGRTLDTGQQKHRRADMPVHNLDIARTFQEIADLLEIEGANHRSY